MSGDWLQVGVDLPEKPEVWRIAGILQLDPDAVVGKLIKVWRWFDAHTESGNAVGVTYALVDSLVGVTGFAEAMAHAGWLTQDGYNLSAPNFSRYNGNTSKTRALTAKRVARCKEKSNAKGNAASVSDALPKEEKRREENKEQEQEQASPAKPQKRKAAELTLPDWLAAIRPADAVPAGDPLFAWAEVAGIPSEWLGLAWAAFEDRYTDDPKTYADWRAVFRKAVKGDWLKLWRTTPQGTQLTTVGAQWRMAA